MKGKRCWHSDELDVSLWQSGKDNFKVIYGLQEKGHLSYAEACKELGQCIMHALACEGRLDNAN